jgi:hypothetical protein
MRRCGAGLFTCLRGLGLTRDSNAKQDPRGSWCKFSVLGLVAGVTGLEPAASGVTGRRSNQLSYTPKPRADVLPHPIDVKRTRRDSARSGGKNFAQCLRRLNLRSPAVVYDRRE